MLEENKDNKLMKCPFCGEDDFDLVGLKSHLINGYCVKFEKTDDVKSMMKEIE